MSTYFISDCHLQASHRAMADKLAQLLANIAHDADALFILGDFFNVWIGDDDQNPFAIEICELLRTHTNNGLNIYIMQGNRDFLINQGFCQRTGCQLLGDPCIIKLYGKNCLLTHGDLLCIDDKKYQFFRKVIRHPITLGIYYCLPFKLRNYIAHEIKRQAKPLRHDAPADKETIQKMCQQYDVNLMIYGHTHKPAIEMNVDTPKQCFVLSDWFENASYLRCDNSGQMRMQVL